MNEIATRTTSKITFLETVYPPISNQEAIWLENDPEVEQLLRQSDFYMIGGRAEAKYLDFAIDPETYIATFDFVIGDFRDPVEIHIRDLPAVAASNAASFWIEGGEKSLRVWDGPIGESDSNVLEWFTTEKLIWDRSRGRAGIQRFNRYREAATYDLLYVGIAKVGDSFDRLINNGHKARMQILGNEPQRYPGARITDEIYLFLFRVQPLIVTTFWSAPIEVVRPLVWLLSLEDGRDGKTPEARGDRREATAGGRADLTGPERCRCNPRARREFGDILPVAA